MVTQRLMREKNLSSARGEEVEDVVAMEMVTIEAETEGTTESVMTLTTIPGRPSVTCMEYSGASVSPFS